MLRSKLNEKKTEKSVEVKQIAGEDKWSVK